MLERTKGRHTDAVEIKVLVRYDQYEKAKKAIAPYLVGENDEECFPWREAFPEFENDHSWAVCLRGARVKENMTQRELAMRLGISPANLSSMEHGKRPIGKEMAKRIADILSVDYRCFL